jgi:hypothetical protein
VVNETVGWTDGIMPAFPKIAEHGQIGVRKSSQILEVLQTLMEQNCKDKSIGILLSGGIDSAILAALMPPGSHAYTIQFMAENTIDESSRARVYAEHIGLEHHTVQITWADYLKHMDILMSNKRSPLHPVEVGLYKAATTAFANGVRTLVIGNGADSTFGGMDKLLSRDWTCDEFIRRYTFVDPRIVLKEPVSMLPVYEQYRMGDRFNVVSFLKVIHGLGIIQAFDNGIGSAGCKTVEPFEQLFLDAPLDMTRIRKGESKYLLRSVFKKLYPGLSAPEKVPFARPMDQWMEGWSGPIRPEFRENIPLNRFTGEQKWLMYCLERFLNLIEESH